MTAAHPPVRVTVAQLRVGADHGVNRDAARHAFHLAAEQGADLLVLPEYASGFVPAGVGREHAEELDGPFVHALRSRAQETGVAVIAGTTLPGEHGEHGEHGDGERAVNAVVAVDGDGELAGVYRKVHLYDAFGHRESDRLEPGPADADPLVLQVGDLRFGVVTCYDLRFPEAARRVVDAGADVLVVPAAWAAGELKAMHWRALAVARAIENTSAVVAVGQAGPGVTGRSVVVRADGTIALELGDEPAIASVDLLPGDVAAVREANPSLANRRYTVVPRED